jgi:hypothetical protein
MEVQTKMQTACGSAALQSNVNCNLLLCVIMKLR